MRHLPGVLAVALSVTTPVLGQSGDGYDLSWNTIDSGTTTVSEGDGYELKGTIGQPDATVDPMENGGFSLSGGLLAEACAEDCDCDDAEVCTYTECIAGVCSNEPRIYGDADGNGAVGIYDVFCVLNGFGGDFSQCAVCNVDIEPCDGDGTIGIFDLFAVLNAFGGVDPCCGV